jgi:hypothetical protein
MNENNGIHMNTKKGNLLIVFLVEILIIASCHTISGGGNNQSKANDDAKPKMTTISLTSTWAPPAEITLQPTITQAEPQSIMNTSVGLCNTVPEPQLNQLHDNSGEEFLSGKFYLCSLLAVSAFDFDEGIVLDKDNQEGDIQLEIGKATFDNHTIYYLKEKNGSLVDELESQNPTYSECRDLVSSPTRLGYVIGAISSSGCVQTNKGRLGYFQVLEMDPDGLESIEVYFVLWNRKD